MDSATNAEDGKQKPTGLARIVDKHTDKFSMSGVSYIKSTKNPVVKFVWSILLIAALGAMGYHLYRSAVNPRFLLSGPHKAYAIR